MGEVESEAAVVGMRCESSEPPPPRPFDSVGGRGTPFFALESPDGGSVRLPGIGVLRRARSMS